MLSSIWNPIQPAAALLRLSVRLWELWMSEAGRSDTVKTFRVLSHSCTQHCGQVSWDFLNCDLWHVALFSTKQWKIVLSFSKFLQYRPVKIKVQKQSWWNMTLQIIYRKEVTSWSELYMWYHPVNTESAHSLMGNLEGPTSIIIFI